MYDKLHTLRSFELFLAPPCLDRTSMMHPDECNFGLQTISSTWPDSRGVLEKLRGELNGSLEKLTTRERFLNEQFDRQMQQYRAQRVQLQDIQVWNGVEGGACDFHQMSCPVLEV